MIPPWVAMDRRRVEKAASRFSSHVRPRDPGGGTVPTVSPRRMTIDDVSHTMELSGGGGGGAQPVPSRFSTVWTEETMAGDTPGRECPHDDVGIRPQMGTVRMSDDRVPFTNIESLYEGGASSLPGATGSLLPVKFPAAPVLLADGPQLGSGQVAVVRVDETPVGDTSGREYPCAEQNRQWPSHVSELHGGSGSPCVGEMLTSLEVTGNVLPVVLAGGSPRAGAVNPAGPDVTVVPGGPVGLCETPSPSSCGILEF